MPTCMLQQNDTTCCRQRAHCGRATLSTPSICTCLPVSDVSVKCRCAIGTPLYIDRHFGSALLSRLGLGLCCYRVGQRL